jgi:hypothetical protein
MPSVFYTACFLVLSRPAFSQAPPAADTAGYVKGGYHKFTDTFYLGEFTTTDGTTLRAYLPTTRMGYERILDYFQTPPGQKPAARRYTLRMEQVRSMRVHGRYYENLLDDGETTDVLALQLLTGPVEVFTYAEPRSVPVPVPIPGAGMLIAGAGYTNNHWYLRRNGEITKLRRGKFAEQLSSYLADCPALAQQVASGAEHYRYQNTLSILSEYNQFLAQAGK